MTKRRIPLLLIVLLAIAGTVMVSREKLSADRAVFSTAAVGWMPSAPPDKGLTETWFCPGVPATGADDVGGAIVIANRTSGPQDFVYTRGRGEYDAAYLSRAVGASVNV